MATIAELSRTLLTPKVVSFLQEPSGLPELPQGLGYEVKVDSTGEPFRTGNVITTGHTEDSPIKIALQALSPIGAFLSGPSGTASFLAQRTLTGLAEQQRPAFQPSIVGRINPMAFQDGDTGFFSSFPSFGEIGQVLQGPVGRGLFDVGLQALSGFVGQQFAPQQLAAVPGGARGAIAVLPRTGGAVAMIGRSFFNRFPNLATAIQGYRNMGQNVTRSSLWSMMKRFGPDFLITGGILTAAAVSELAIAGPGRRRMNPGNVKALRRAHRRMKSFHNVCLTNDRLLGGRRSKRKGSFGSGATSVVNVK